LYEDAVILSQSVELRVPKDAFVNVWSPALKPTETAAGGYRVLRWESSQLKPTVGKEADAEKEAKGKLVWTPEQELEATQGKLPTIAWTNFKSWEDVGAWYRGLEKDRTVPDEEIKAKVAELTVGKTTEEEKVRAVYAYVATQIRYIGVAFGVGRYQPHRAEDVMQNRYGDCKDKHTLLASMLEALGLHPDAVLIGAGIRFNEAVPSPSAFNHLITMVPVDGKDVWPDATAEVAPYKMLMYSIRDKQALVIPSSGVAQVDKEGISNSRLTITFRGDDELLMRSVLRQLSPAQYDPVVQQLSNNLGFSGTTSHAEVSRPDDTAEPLTISYDDKRERADEWANGEYKIYPQFTAVLLPKPDVKTPPVRAIWLGVPRTETSTSSMKLPEGWGVELPIAVHERSAYTTYDESYRFDKGTLYAERRIEVLQEKVPESDWKSYKKWTDAVNLGSDLSVKLTTNTTAKRAVEDGAAKGAALAEQDDAEAHRLVAEEKSAEARGLVTVAYKEVREHDWETARLNLDKAKDLKANRFVDDLWLSGFSTGADV
jgi:Transglutaminase-like superfamily